MSNHHDELSNSEATAVMKVMSTAVMLTEIWNWRDLRTATPDNGGDDRGKVVIHEDNVRCLLCDEKPTLAILRAGPSLVPSPVTPILLSILVDPPLFEGLLWGNFLYCARLASGAGIVASDVVTGDQSTVTRNDFTRFQKREVADKDFLRKF
jgi:hypothetical protein